MPPPEIHVVVEALSDLVYGDRMLENGLMDHTLDNLIADRRMAPVIAVFLSRVSRDEYGGNSDASADYVRLITEELIPHLDRHYR